MPASKMLALTVLALAFGVPAEANDQARCLSPEERRSTIANQVAVPLGRAVRAVRNRVAGEVVRARLCEGNQGLVYELTVLSRNGKVTRAIVDARNGKLLGRR